MRAKKVYVFSTNFLDIHIWLAGTLPFEKLSILEKIVLCFKTCSLTSNHPINTISERIERKKATTSSSLSIKYIVNLFKCIPKARQGKAWHAYSLELVSDCLFVCDIFVYVMHFSFGGIHYFIYPNVMHRV